MTKRCFVAGFPIRQSRSPLIHSHWIAERGLDASYERLEVKPEDLPDLITKVRDGMYLGGNLTIPLKQAVLPLLDDITEDARAMGAVNTVCLHEGRVTGANTDVAGFFAHLDLTCPGWDQKPASVLLLGAGGAANAIVYGLLARNIRSLSIANRSEGRITALLDHILKTRPATVPLIRETWPVTPDLLAASDLVINSTSLGMTGQPPLDLAWPTYVSQTIAYDIVYAPLITPFLRDAEFKGGRTVDGLGMLLHQAALAFSHWFGTVPAVTPELRALVEADLASKGS